MYLLLLNPSPSSSRCALLTRMRIDARSASFLALSDRSLHPILRVAFGSNFRIGYWPTNDRSRPTVIFGSILLPRATAKSSHFRLLRRAVRLLN